MDTIVANMRSFLDELDRVYKSIADADKVRTSCKNVEFVLGRGGESNRACALLLIYVCVTCCTCVVRLVYVHVCAFRGLCPRIPDGHHLTNLRLADSLLLCQSGLLVLWKCFTPYHFSFRRSFFPPLTHSLLSRDDAPRRGGFDSFSQEPQKIWDLYKAAADRWLLPMDRY